MKLWHAGEIMELLKEVENTPSTNTPSTIFN